jgi:hypothetical protein
MPAVITWTIVLALMCAALACIAFRNRISH